MLDAVGFKQPARKSARKSTLDAVLGDVAPWFFVARAAQGVCATPSEKFVEFQGP